MNWQRWRIRTVLFLALLIIIYWFGLFSDRNTKALRTPDADDQEPLEELTGDEILEESYFRLVDEDGLTIVITGRRLRVGDGYLAADNRLYEVSAVEGHVARARFVEKIEHEFTRESARAPGGEIPVQGRPAYRIAIYHSHNAESYVPSDGTDSIYGRGGIHDVGVAFKEALEKKGIDVLYSDRLHLPHDRGAYRRSRVTAQELLRQRPDAVFDVHRDAAPWEAYAMELADGEWVTQIQFVVGLSNPGIATNRNFAFDLKGYADRIHPGLVRGVFLIWGGYNQDLSPLSLLLEVGAHTNSKEAAIQGITRFADVVGYYFYGPDTLGNGDTAREPDPENLPPALYRDAGGISGAVSGTVIGLLLTSLGAALGFYFLNNPGALEKLFLWWEHFPDVISTWSRQARVAVHGFPAAARRAWIDYPANVQYSWRRLIQEWHDLPRLLTATVEYGRLLTGQILYTLKTLWKALPGNLRKTRALFAREIVEFPGWVSRWLRRAVRAIGRAAAMVARVLPPVFALIRENLAQAWAGVKEETIYLFSRLRGKIDLLRRRIRP
ncbi:MAG: stage II sporulation protein P [Bacillota bacterium]